MQPIQVAPALKIQVHRKIAECISKIESHYKVRLHRPKVLFSRRGTIAAVANSANWLVDFNPVLLNENVDEFVANTVPHEVAHLACDIIYPEPDPKSGKRDVHGKRWQELMSLLGVKPNLYHSYDVTNAKIRRKITRYRYVCNCCKKAIDVGPRRHATLQANPSAFWHTVCGSEALLTYSGPVVETPTLPPALKLPVESKMETCYNIFTRNPNRSRTDIIADFVGAVNCTDAAAATYLKVCQMWSLTLKQQT